MIGMHMSTTEEVVLRGVLATLEEHAEDLTSDQRRHLADLLDPYFDDDWVCDLSLASGVLRDGGEGSLDEAAIFLRTHLDVRSISFEEAFAIEVLADGDEEESR